MRWAILNVFGTRDVAAQLIPIVGLLLAIGGCGGVFAEPGHPVISPSYACTGDDVTITVPLAVKVDRLRIFDNYDRLRHEGRPQPRGDFAITFYDVREDEMPFRIKVMKKRT